MPATHRVLVAAATLCVGSLAVFAGPAAGLSPNHPLHAVAPVGDVDGLVNSGPAARVDDHWQIRSTGVTDAIEGYANRTSVLPGQKVNLYVSTTAHSFHVKAFRMGWYKHRTGKLIWTSQRVRGRRQPPGRMESRRMIETNWHRSLTIQTRGWPAGDYLLRLDSSAGHQRFVPLTVRAPSAVGRVVLVNAVTTWQAYNLWGGYDLYQGADGSFASRSRAVSFDRPYSIENGAGQFLERELPIVIQAERLRLPLDYITDEDLQKKGALRGALAVVSMGHDEYWSPRMRDVLTKARDRGANLAFFGANAIFRRIRYGKTHLGSGRVEINYKIAAEDPLYGKDNARVTADWPSPPDARPESSLIGAQYGCFPGSTRVTGVVAESHNWVFAGTHVRSGTRLPGLIGPEIDAAQHQYPTPRGIKTLMRSPVHCPGGDPPDADATLYTASSGARVFDAGTIDWACDVGGGCYATQLTTRVVRRATDNILSAFARRHGAHHG